MMESEFIEWAYNQHDVVCNQKYDKVMPYSQHLRFVKAQCVKFQWLLDIERDEYSLARMAVAGHDLIEDARITWNDLRQMVGEEVADAIYACTELRGKTREERHGPEYFEGLKNSRIGLFVKLCDIIANVTYSILTGSSMLNKYKKEFPNFNATLSDAHDAKFWPMFVYLENLLSLRVKNGISNTSKQEA